ncbi:lamin tail domain-containing protein [Patescibacteria group bacterium]|nr:lamin tail domain-containing protein [Patescibacteria group bacterium]
MSVFLCLVFIFFLFQPLAVQGVSLNVVINEIAWMGTGVSYNDEWIELYNNGSDINLDGWVLKADDGSPKINLSGIIPAKGFFLLERTDDNTVPEIPADLIYTGALGNSGENLKLYDNSGNIINEVNCSDGWLAGNNETKQTMEKTDSGWQTSQNPEGTPKSENSTPPEKLPGVGPPATEEEKTEPAEDSPPLATPVSYPAGVVFSEILPSPEGPDAENEWIELYNQNDFEVDLSNWTIQDIQGKTKTYTLNTKIPANGYLVLLRPETKITLNNTGDGLNLFNPNGEIVDSITSGKASLGQSYNRTQSGWAWSTTLTPGAKNIVPTPQTPKQKSKEKKSENGSLEANFLTEKGTAAVSTITESSGFSTLLIAFVVAIFSGIAILIVKNSLS